MKRKIVSIILVFMLIILQTQIIFAESEQELKDKKQELQDQKEAAEARQGEVEEELDAQMTEIQNLDSKIEENENQIDELSSKIENLETSITEKTVEIDKKQKEYEEKDELLRKRLVALYEDGDVSFLDLLFDSENILDFISSYDTIQQITECDTELMESISKEKQEIEATKKTLEEEKAQVESAKKEKEVLSTSLNAKKQERQKKVDALSEEQKSLQQQIDDFVGEINAVDNAIKEALEKAQEQINNANSSSGGSGSAGLQFDGSFIWPCNTKIITSTVKQRWGRWHKGIDIGARYENVYASASGYAYNLNNPGGYGTYIMVVHGSGYITLYGHLSTSHISDGEYVKQGDVIATSGNTGASTGAHLHFEIRKSSSISSYFNAAFLDPLDYLPGGWTMTAGADKAS